MSSAYARSGTTRAHSWARSRVVPRRVTLAGVQLYHGTPNLARVLKAGVVRPSTAPEPLPDLAATLAAYRKLLAGWLRRWPKSPEAWQWLDVQGHRGWVDAAVIPMRGYAYATTNLATAQRYAGRLGQGRDPGVVLVAADPRKLLPDEDWIGCVAAAAFSDCSDCDLDIRGDQAAYDVWAVDLPGLVSPALQAQIHAERDFIQAEIDWDEFCTLPLQAVIGRTVIRAVGRTPRGLAWLRAGLEFADRFAHQGALRVIAAIGTADDRV